MVNAAALSPDRDSRRRIVHIITTLSRGGAEANLYRLICATRDSWDTVVISLADEGVYGVKLRTLGVTVLCCRINGAVGLFPGFLRLLGFMRRLRPDVVQTWMYHADLLGGVAARLLGFNAVLWGIRCLKQRASVNWSTRVATRLCALLSGTVPVAIVSCSAQAAAEHRRSGYAGSKLMVIPNGYDCGTLRLDRPAGQQLRSRWGVRPGEVLIGMVARWDPLKDHANLLTALRLLAREHDQIRCVLVGQGMEPGNRELDELLQQNSLRSRVVLAGPQDDIGAVMSALDLHVLSSMSEAFPNVVAEAMACGTPCVVTDVGDAAMIVGDQGWCVPPRDPAALCAAMHAALTLLASGASDALRAACRQRIEEKFGHENMASAYQDAWSRAIGARGT
jgi:glycosyltransferase involved in cell wall biosynthesis